VIKLLWVKEPWLGLIESGRKTIEHRPRRVSYRGPVLLCSSKVAMRGGWADEFADAAGPLGVTRCIVELYDCTPFEAAHVRRAVPTERHLPPLARATLASDWGGWALHLRLIETVSYLPVTGRLGMANPNADELDAMPWLADYRLPARTSSSTSAPST
jgi:hypothetical protein